MASMRGEASNANKIRLNGDLALRMSLRSAGNLLPTEFRRPDYASNRTPPSKDGQSATVRVFPVGNGSAAQRTSQKLSAHRGTREACLSFTQVSGMLPQPFFPREEREADESIVSEHGHVLNYDTTSLYN